MPTCIPCHEKVAPVGWGRHGGSGSRVLPNAASVGHCEENQSVQSYAVIIHEDPESGFWAEVPALPDCYSQGETVDELKHNIPEAIGDSPR